MIYTHVKKSLRSMFAAALLLSCPQVEISIYSTCKRISQKILRNVLKFAMIMCDDDLMSLGFSVTRSNMEEIVLRGPIGSIDTRVINSVSFKYLRLFAYTDK